MGEGGDGFAEHLAIGDNVRGADLEQVVKPARNHVRRLDFCTVGHRLVKGLQRIGAGVVERHLDKGDMGQAKFFEIKIGAIAANDPVALKTADAGQCR